MSASRKQNEKKPHLWLNDLLISKLSYSHNNDPVKRTQNKKDFFYQKFGNIFSKSRIGVINHGSTICLYYLLGQTDSCTIHERPLSAEGYHPPFIFHLRLYETSDRGSDRPTAVSQELFFITEWELLNLEVFYWL